MFQSIVVRSGSMEDARCLNPGQSGVSGQFPQKLSYACSSAVEVSIGATYVARCSGRAKT